MRITQRPGPFPVYVVEPLEGFDGGPRVLYLHGGAYVGEIALQHWTFVAGLVRSLGAQVLLPIYPLAPEATWRDSYDEISTLVLEGEPVPYLMGDSAGGGLALALASRLRHRHQLYDIPGLVLISPWVDLTLSESEAELRAYRDPWLTAANLRLAGQLWAGSDDPTDPDLSPINADLRDLPRTLVLSGTRDLLHGQSLALARRLAEAGTTTELEIGRGLLHVYPLLPIPEAARGAERIHQFTRPASTASGP